jgi:DNA-binding GntR family transcriptional regulator
MGEAIDIAIRDPAGVETSRSLYGRIRDDIISGRLMADQRLKVADLAERLGTSTNPVREALQQLRGEGFVVMEPNRGARVRSMGDDFIRDLYEMEMLIQPTLARWFATVATPLDVQTLETLQDEIEALNFSDPVRHAQLDFRFHMLMYERHSNRLMLELWCKYREILQAFSRRHPVALYRRAAVRVEHREIIRCLKAQDVDGLVAIIRQHVEGAGRHIVEQIRAARHERGAMRPAEVAAF